MPPPLPPKVWFNSTMPCGQHLFTSLLLFPGSPSVPLAFHCRSAIFRATTVAIQLILNQLLAHRVGISLFSAKIFRNSRIGYCFTRTQKDYRIVVLSMIGTPKQQ